MTLATLLIACPALASFTDIGAGLTPVSSPAIAWGDFDGDGQLDLVVVGSIMFGVSGNVYKQSSGAFASVGVPTDAGVQTGDVAWGDYDRDGDLDLVVVGDTRDSLITHIYRNDPGTFVNIGAGLVALKNCAVAWGDFDNDGDLDLALAGDTGISLVSIVARNDGGMFHPIGGPFVGLENACLTWADYDRDGDLDLAMSGSTSSGSDVCTAYLYRNDHGSFVSQPWGVTGVCIGDMAWADYDNDGDLDLVISGRLTSPPGGATTKLYDNQSGTFVASAAALSPSFVCSIGWGDYDNDGWSDLLIAGGTGSFPNFSLYHNTHPGFTVVSTGLPGVAPAAVAWGDYDGDTRLDIAIAGTTMSSDIARIYHNSRRPAGRSALGARRVVRQYRESGLGRVLVERIDRSAGIRHGAQLQPADRHDTGRQPGHVADGNGSGQASRSAARQRAGGAAVGDQEERVPGQHLLLERSSDRSILCDIGLCARAVAGAARRRRPR
jgi:hypothetical protein